MIKYKPADAQASPRFCGVRTFMRLLYVQTVDDIDYNFPNTSLDITIFSTSLVPS